MAMNFYIVKGKAVIMISVALLLLALGLEVFTDFGSISFEELVFENVDVKNIALATTSVKKSNDTVLDTVFKKQNFNKLTEMNLTEVKDIKASKILTNEDIWHLPTRVGEITQYPSYGHVAFDITSKRGVNEDIYPVANGVVSGIFTDSAGALIVTVYHNIEGVSYTSEYVHLSRYSDSLYVGKEVTINDSLGKMGQTGFAYGVHLHFALIDCKLFDENDSNCKDINSFYNYGRKRFNEGFSGLGNLISIPYSWEY